MKRAPRFSYLKGTRIGLRIEISVALASGRDRSNRVAPGVLVWIRALL